MVAKKVLSVKVVLLIRAFNLKVKRQTRYCKEKRKTLKIIVLLTSALGIFQIPFSFLMSTNAQCIHYHNCNMIPVLQTPCSWLFVYIYIYICMFGFCFVVVLKKKSNTPLHFPPTHSQKTSTAKIAGEGSDPHPLLDDLLRLLL